MNVLILHAGGAHASRRLVSKFQSLLSDAGDSHPRLDRELPRREIAVGERSRYALADTVENYRGVVHVFIRCVGEDMQPMVDLTPGDLLTRRSTFWGEDAWRNLALRIRDPSVAAPRWRADVRTDLNWVVRDAKHGHAASLIDIASPAWAERNEVSMDDAEKEQRRLQAQVAPLIGSLHGGDPSRAEQASERVRDVLAQKHGR